jgi:hypothetical protein
VYRPLSDIYRVSKAIIPARLLRFSFQHVFPKTALANTRGGGYGLGSFCGPDLSNPAAVLFWRFKNLWQLKYA